MKNSILIILFGFFMVFTMFFPSVQTRGFASNQKSNLDQISIVAKSAILVDHASGEIVYEKNAHEKLPIASMTKLATLAIVFDAIDNKIIKLTDEVVVSKNAADTGGSSAFLDAGSKYKLADLIKTIIIASANDSAVAVAEFVSGTESAFVARMNKFVESLGLVDTNFENSTGLPAKNHYSSAFDMVQIYKKICDNSIYKTYSKIWMDELMHPSGRRTELVNTNRLIKTYDGIEGGKTGYTDAAKFCLTASACRAGMRLVGVVIGADNSKTRFAEMAKLFDYGFANFKSEEIINSQVPVSILKPKNAKTMSEVFPSNNVVKFLNKTDTSKFSTDFQIYEQKAPLKRGDVVGKMFVFDENNMVVDEVELIVSNDIEEIDFLYNLKNILKVW